MKELKSTPLNEFHRRHGARLIDFAGWEMPVQYGGIIEEHLAVRRSAGLFDVSHMGEIVVRGRGAERFVDFVVTNDIGSLEEGRALYTLMCYPEGGVVDDLLVYRLGEEEFLLCVNASNTEGDFKWLSSHKEGFDCVVEDVSREYGQLALQGPKAEGILSKIFEGIGGLKRFGFLKRLVNGVEVMVSRTGYTGEDGFELYCPWAETEGIAELVFEESISEGVVLAGLGARDSLRLEAGYPLYGHEISKDITPLEAHLDFAVKLDKSCNFIGKEALVRQRKEGLRGEVVFFKLDDRRIARQGAIIFDGAREIGRVVSGAFSPCLNQPIGSGYVRCSRSEKLEVDIRGKRIRLLIVEIPFV